MNKRLGLIVRCDDGGLGSLSQDFYKFLEPSKTLVIWGQYQNHPERFPGGIQCQNGIPTLAQIDEFLKDIDAVLTFETAYNWNIFKEAKKRGIKTILMPMFEWTPDPLPIQPDLLICPSKLEYDLYEGNKVYLPVPVDREKHPFKLRTTAETFVFNNGHGGTLNRNSAREVIEAISRTVLDVKFIVRSQVQLPDVIKDPRITYVLGDQPKESLFSEGDVLIFPHKFDGLSLPIQEAMSSGMALITTDIYPHNQYVPQECLFEADGFGKARMGERYREFRRAFISTKTLAQKIDQMANQDITELSQRMNEIAEEWSWNNLGEKYLEVINNI